VGDVVRAKFRSYSIHPAQTRAGPEAGAPEKFERGAAL